MLISTCMTPIFFRCFLALGICDGSLMADSDFEKQNASSTASNQCFMLLQFFEKSRHESSLQFSNGILSGIVSWRSL